LKIYILCGNAAYNRGDRANLTAQIRLLKEKFPEADITLDSFRPEVDKAWYGVRVLKRGWFLTFEQMRYLKNADHVIWGGGALVADNACKVLVPWWFLVIAFVRFVLGKRVVAWAHGVVLETRLGRSFAKQVYRITNELSFRDPHSYETVRALLPSRKMTLTADAVACIQVGEAAEGSRVLQSAGIILKHDRPVFGFALTFWPFYSSRHDLIPYMLWPRFRKKTLYSLARHNQGVSKVIRGLIEKYDAQILLMPRYPCEPWKDIRYLKEIARHSKHPERVHVFENDEHPPERYFSILHHVDCLIATAMHDAMVATLMEKPCVNFYYEDKGREFFEAMGLLGHTAPWDCLFDDSGKVIAKVETRLKNWKSGVPALKVKTQEFQQRAKRNLELLCQSQP
jgi:polysaccharide pyruvyl transferase WcaK-like protein